MILNLNVKGDLTQLFFYSKVYTICASSMQTF